MSQKVGKAFSIFGTVLCAAMLALSALGIFSQTPYIWVILLICNGTILICQFAKKNK